MSSWNDEERDISVDTEDDYTLRELVLDIEADRPTKIEFTLKHRPSAELTWESEFKPFFRAASPPAATDPAALGT